MAPMPISSFSLGFVSGTNGAEGGLGGWLENMALLRVARVFMKKRASIIEMTASETPTPIPTRVARGAWADCDAASDPPSCLFCDWSTLGGAVSVTLVSQFLTDWQHSSPGLLLQKSHPELGLKKPNTQQTHVINMMYNKGGV
jgi:hypothetical protein